MADQKNSNDTQTDKSIDDLLQEYAGDVKSNDLDDFLKNDDAFESDDADNSEDNEKIMAESGGKSGGFLTMMFIVLAFGAAGAGAYVYMNRDDGMTSIMGGFDAPAQTADAPIDVAPESTPSMPAPIETSAAPSTEELAQPTPIVNDEAPAADTLAMPEMTPPEGATPDTEVTTLAPMQAPTTEAPTAEAPAAETTAPVADASQAVDAWQSGNDMPPAVTDSSAPLPEKAVAEVKAKPPVKAAAKKEEPKEDVKTAEAAPAKKREYSTMDDALSPPFVAIQEEKKTEAKAETKTAEATETKAPAKRVEKPEDAAYIPPAKGKMAPVVEGASTTASVSSSSNENVADVSKATGDTAKLVAQGGGKIDLPVSGGTSAVPAPVAASMMPTTTAEPQMRTTTLAISGGRSMPDGTVVQTRTYAQMPATDQGTKPAAEAPAAEAPVAEAPRPSGQGQTAQEMEAEEAGFTKSTPSAPVATPAKAPEVSAAPAAAPSGSSDTDAKAVVAQAMAAEKAGDKQGALALFQKALEVDAVYGNGSSIDRGMVYDRIGTLRAGS